MTSDDYLPCDGATREDFQSFYKWTIEDAIAAQGEWEKSDHHPAAKGPFPQWLAAQELKKLADAYRETGERKHILEAVYICAQNDLPMPQWCMMAYIAAYRDVWFKAVTSWDDVFGCPHKKGTHANDLREKGTNAFKVLRRVEEIHQTENAPIDGGLFDRVGRELGVGGKTKTAELYYYAKGGMEHKKRLPE